MEVIKMRCPDCQKELRYSFEYCPHCGGDLNKASKQRATKGKDGIIDKVWFMRG